MTPLQFFVIGDPIAHSLSPVIHGAAFASLGLPHRYGTLRVSTEGLADVLGRVRSGEIAGLNVTVPHKIAVMERCDRLLPEARAASAVNTVFAETEPSADGGACLVGENTDVGGFAADLTSAGVRPRIALVLGTGGAARAIALALDRLGSRVTVAGRAIDKALSLVAGLGFGNAIGWDALSGVPESFDLVVNATSAGMAGGAPGSATVQALSATPHARDTVVYDTVYRAPDGGIETELVRVARSRGLRALDGTGMLVEQGARALEHFLKRSIPVETKAAMRAALLQALSSAAR